MCSVEKSHAERQIDDVLKTYDVQREHYKQLHDTYFQRIHLFMAAAQAALVGLAVSTAPDIQEKFGWGGAVIAIILFSMAGVAGAVLWYTMGVRMHQFLEFCRRAMRESEAKARQLGLPLGCHLWEAWLVADKGPPKVDSITDARWGPTGEERGGEGLCMGDGGGSGADPKGEKSPHQEDRRVVFPMTGETFPTDCVSFLYRGRLLGGMASMETYLALVFGLGWLVVLWICAWAMGSAGYRSAPCAAILFSAGAILAVLFPEMRRLHPRLHCCRCCIGVLSLVCFVLSVVFLARHIIEKLVQYLPRP